MVADSSGNQHDGACSGTTTWVAGKVGNAISLDGASGYVIVPAGLFASLSEMTVATWVELDQAANWNRIFDFGNRRLSDAGTATSPSVYMFLTPQNSMTHRLRFAMTTSGASGEQVVEGSDALAIGVWTHITVSLNAQTASLYVNGVLVRATSPFNLSPTSLGATLNNWIGRSLYPPDPYFKGKFDDFRVYDRVLTAAEVASVAQL